MKIPICILLLCFLGCHKVDQRQQKVIAFVKKYSRKHFLDTGKDFQNLSFTSLHIVKTHFMQTKEGAEMLKQMQLDDDSVKMIDTLLEKFKKKRSYAPINIYDRGKRLIDRDVAFMNKLLKGEMHFKGVLKYYSVTQYYKTHDKFDQDIYHKRKFEIDTSILNVLSIKDTVVDADDIHW